MKKEKMKYYVRKNIISFVIGLILFGSLGVYAIDRINIIWKLRSICHSNISIKRCKL